MTKKLYERAVVEAFLASERLPLSALEDWEHEGPDALIRVDGRLIGVEVTTLTEANGRQAIAPQKWTVEAKRIVEAARISFESSNPRPFVVYFQFRPEWRPPDKRTAPRLAFELAAVVEAAGHTLSPDAEEPLELKDPRPAVSWGYIGSIPTELGSHWAPSFGFKGLRAGAKDIASTVARKESKLDDYKRAALEVWLLIDCNLTGQGVALYLPERNVEVVTGFGRVLCCGFGRFEWVEVRCIPRNESGVPMTG